MWCCRKREIFIEEPGEEEPPKPIKPFHDTFKIVTFTMSAGMLYPNPAIDKFKLKILLTVLASCMPITLLVLVDIYSSWQRRDILNIVRHGTVIVPFLLVLTKMFLMYFNRAASKEIIDEINRDHEMLNELPERYRPIIEDHFSQAKFGEKYWLVIVIKSVMVFPIMSSVLNIYEFTHKSEPQKYMVHDVNMPFMEPEMRFETPYFELVYAYMLYCCVIYLLNFVGYDGFFGLAIRHACLKMQLYCQAMQDALLLKDPNQIIDKMVEVIRAQNRVYKYVETIQETFNFWLGMIFIGTVIHVCNCMYQIMEGLGFDLKYTIFMFGSVIHIYLPCKYASQLKSMSTDTATLIYCCGWEAVDDQRVRKLVVFMIARAQIPITITAFNMLTFDMELFVSILHTSYSMFTLLRPTD